MSYTKVKQVDLPAGSLLLRYKESEDFTDCYQIKIKHKVDFEDYIFAFYTSWLFKLERFIIKWLVNKPSTDCDVEMLARDETNKFAAWSVEDRAKNQLLLCDYQGQTRSWLSLVNAKDNTSIIYFGSAVVYSKDKNGRAIEFNKIFKFLSIFHHFYSKALITCAAKKLQRLRNKT